MDNETTSVALIDATFEVTLREPVPAHLQDEVESMLHGIDSLSWEDDDRVLITASGMDRDDIESEVDSVLMDLPEIKQFLVDLILPKVQEVRGGLMETRDNKTLTPAEMEFKLTSYIIKLHAVLSLLGDLDNELP